MTEREGPPSFTVDREWPPSFTVDEAPAPSADPIPVPRSGRSEPVPGAGPGRGPGAAGSADPLSPLAVLGVIAIPGLGLGWFFVSWRVLASPLTDAIGETVGSLAVVLLAVSIVGASRRG